MREGLWVAVCGVAVGCGDLTSSHLRPEPKVRANVEVVNVGGRDLMAFASEAEARASLMWPEIYWYDQDVQWSGKDARYFSTLTYFGNRALIDGDLVFSSKTGSFAPIRVQTGRVNLFDRRQGIATGQRSTQAHSACGLGATLSLTYLAATDIFIHTAGAFELGRDVRSDASVAYQPECTCERGVGGGDPVREHISDASYDAYSPGISEDTGCAGGSSDGGSNPGSGTQFGEGDYTEGETVDWGTGVGNGGTSECGTAAQVRWVCIDIFVEGAWKTWSCGWATTC
jgi:hypothetical protein